MKNRINLLKHHHNQPLCFFYCFFFLLIHNEKFHNQDIRKRTYQNITWGVKKIKNIITHSNKVNVKVVKQNEGVCMLEEKRRQQIYK